MLDAWFGATSLDGRLQTEREIIRFLTTDLPIIQTVADPRRYFQGKGVTGTIPKTGVDIRVSNSWNVHEWDKG